jgi:hypothetical protein
METVYRESYLNIGLEIYDPIDDYEKPSIGVGWETASFQASDQVPSLDIPSSSDLFIWPSSSAANSSIVSSYLQGSVLPHTQETWFVDEAMQLQAPAIGIEDDDIIRSVQSINDTFQYSDNLVVPGSLMNHGTWPLCPLIQRVTSVSVKMMLSQLMKDPFVNFPLEKLCNFKLLSLIARIML